jgi:hypothetical protein
MYVSCSYIIENMFIKRVFVISIIENNYRCVKYIFNKFSKIPIITCNSTDTIVKILLTKWLVVFNYRYLQ